MIVGVSRMKAVTLHGADIWAYDASVSLVLAETIGLVEAEASADSPQWWRGVEHDLRNQAAISDFQLDLDLSLTDGEREQLAELFDRAADSIAQRETFTEAEAVDWHLIGDLTVIFRGHEPTDTTPIAELGHALAELIRGSLPLPPPGTLWYYGAPGGRRTIGTNRSQARGTGS